MKKILMAVCVIGFSCTLSAEILRYSFSGNLSMLRDDGHDLPASVDISDTFIANFDYDLSVVPHFVRGPYTFAPVFGAEGFLFSLEIDSAKWAWSSKYMDDFSQNGFTTVGGGWNVVAKSSGVENPGFTSYLGDVWSKFTIADSSVVYSSGELPDENNLSFLGNIGDPGNSFFSISSTGSVGHEWQIIFNVTSGSVSTIPEPSTYALLVGGVIIGFCFIRRWTLK